MDLRILVRRSGGADRAISFRAGRGLKWSFMAGACLLVNGFALLREIDR